MTTTATFFIKAKSKNNKITKAILNQKTLEIQRWPHPLATVSLNAATIIAFFLSKMPVFMRMSMNISARLATVVSVINVNHFVMHRKRRRGREWERDTQLSCLWWDRVKFPHKQNAIGDACQVWNHSRWARRIRCWEWGGEEGQIIIDLAARTHNLALKLLLTYEFQINHSCAGVIR